MNAILDRLQSAVHLHQSGRLDDAEPLYRDILRADPTNPNALYLLGTVQYQRGELGSARLLLTKAVASNPRHAEARNNLGLVFHELGEHDRAAENFRAAIYASPAYADAHYNLGNLHRDRGELEQAVASFRNAVRCQPDFARAFDNLGLALRELDHPAEAIAAHRESIRLNPRSAASFNNLGAALKNAGDHAAAVDAFQSALAIDPKLAIARSNLGITLARLRRIAEAESECRRALACDPNSPVARNNLGLVLFLQGRDAEALPEFQQAVRLDPSFADAFNNLGSALFRSKQISDAASTYRRSIEIRPSVVAHKNLGSILDQSGDWDAARDSFRAASRLRGRDPLLELRAAAVCPTLWDATDQIVEYRVALEAHLDRCIELEIRRPVAELLDLDLRPSFNLQFHGLCDRVIREKFAAVFRHSVPTESPPPRSSGKPTVGFCLSAGHEYAFARSIGGLFQHFRADLWRPVIVCPASSVEKIQAAISFDGLDLLPLPPHLDDIVETVRDARFDMLYHWEIATGSLNYFLPMMRLAPLQCTSWGIQVTSGVPAVDDYLSTELVEPADAQNQYTEHLVRLQTMLSYQRPMECLIQPLSRDQLGLPVDADIYLCAQQLGKFHPDFDPILAGILRRDPAGHIVVTRSSFASETARLQNRFQRTMPDVTDRILWIDKQVGPAYASLVQAADVVLDPIHFGGVNTTYDAFSAGKVVVTLPSQFHRGRYTLGCYRRMNIADPIANSPDDYISIAVRYGTDPDFRRHTEHRILDARHALFEQRDVATELEEWMIDAIERHRRAET